MVHTDQSSRESTAMVQGIIEEVAPRMAPSSTPRRQRQVSSSASAARTPSATVLEIDDDVAPVAPPSTPSRQKPVSSVPNVMRRYRFVVDSQLQDLSIRHKAGAWRVILNGETMENVVYAFSCRCGAATFSLPTPSGGEMPACFKMECSESTDVWSYTLRVDGLAIPHHADGREETATSGVASSPCSTTGGRGQAESTPTVLVEDVLSD